MKNINLKICYLHWTLCLLTSAFCLSQVGDCPRALGEAYLDAGNVRARIVNTGGLFYRGEPHVYEVPKGTGSNSIFAASIWIAGLIDGELHGTATRYGEWELWPGPLDANGNPPADCSVYDRIWEIRREDIEAYNRGLLVSDNLRDWPWQLGAPVLDGDGNPENYDLAGGDRPRLAGDQLLWWIMNDRGNSHESSQGEPIGLEVLASAHAFSHPGFGGYQTFYRYRLINKNVAPLIDTYFGLFTDVDLGDYADDYIGSDSLLHLGYVYNADNEDVSGEGYGLAPPAIGFTFLESAVADVDAFDNDRDGEIDEAGEMLGTSSVMQYFGGGGPEGDPQSIKDYYLYMQGRWKDDRPLLMGPYGTDRYEWPEYLPKNPTRFYYSGDPVTRSFWTEMNTNNRGTPSQPADRRFVTSTGPFSIAPFDTVDIAFAIVWSRGLDHLDSVTRLKQDIVRSRSAADFILHQPGLHYNPPPASNPSFVLGFDQNHPNPFSTSTMLRYSLPKAMQVRLTVYDVLGREIEVPVEGSQNEGIYSVEFDGSRLPAGLYFARIELDHLRFTKKMVLSK
jgi:hypothetical protein